MKLKPNIIKISHQGIYFSLSLYFTVVASSLWGQDSSLDTPIVPTEIIANQGRDVQTDVASAVTIIEREEIENRQASNFVGLLESIPNISLLNPAETPQGGTMLIRGLGSTPGIWGSDGTITVAIDGVTSMGEPLYRNSAIYLADPELFRRVTVTRGSSGGYAYSSAGSTATIMAELKDATDFLAPGQTVSFRQKFGYEDNGVGRRSSSILSMALSEKIDLLLSYGYSDLGQRNMTNGETLNTDYDSKMTLAKLNYHFSDESVLTFGTTKTEIFEEDAAYDSLLWENEYLSIEDRRTIDFTSYINYNYNPIDSDLIDFNTKLSYKSEIVDRVDFRENITDTIAIKTSNQSIFQTGDFFTHNSEIGFEYKTREISRMADRLDYNDNNNPGGTIENYAFFASDEIVTPLGFSLTPQLRFEDQKLRTENSDPRVFNHDGNTYHYSRYSGGVEAKYKLKEAFTVFGGIFYNNKFPVIKWFDSTESDDGSENTAGKAFNKEIGISFDNSKQTTTDHKIKAKLVLFDNDLKEETELIYDKITVKGAEFELSYVNPYFYANFTASRVRGKQFGPELESTRSAQALGVYERVDLMNEFVDQSTSNERKAEIMALLTGAGSKTWTEVTNYNGNWDNATPDTFQLTLGKHFMDHQLNVLAEVKYVRAQNRVNPKNIWIGEYFEEGDIPYDEVVDGGTYYRSPHSGGYGPSKSHSTISLSSTYKPKSGFFKGYEFRARVNNVLDKEYQLYLVEEPSMRRNFRLSIAKTF